MDRRYVAEMTKPFWDSLYRLKLNKGRITLDNIIDQVQRDFGVRVTRKEVLEVLIMACIWRISSHEVVYFDRFLIWKSMSMNETE